MQYRYRIQSLKTGWGMEAEATPEGKRKLEAARRSMKSKFKFCRVFLTKQFVPSHQELLVPFRLTTQGKPYEGGVEYA